MLLLLCLFLLTGRKQRVVLNAQAPEWLPFTGGVPRGQLLIPVLFIIQYINEIKILSFKIYRRCKIEWEITHYIRLGNYPGRSRPDPSVVRKMADVRHLPNVKFILIGYRSGNHKYHIGDPLKVVHEERDLGVTFSSELKQVNHCESPCKEANTTLGFITWDFEVKTPGVVILVQLARKVPPGICRVVPIIKVQERLNYLIENSDAHEDYPSLRTKPCEK